MGGKNLFEALFVLFLGPRVTSHALSVCGHPLYFFNHD